MVRPARAQQASTTHLNDDVPNAEDGAWLAGSSDDELDGGAEPGPGTMLERDAKAREQRFWNEGFREGVEAGKEETVQHGFNIGFQEGYAAGRQWGSDRAYAPALKVLAAKLGGSGEGEGAPNPLADALGAAPEEPGVDRARLMLADLLISRPDMTLASEAAANGLGGKSAAGTGELLTAFATLR